VNHDQGGEVSSSASGASPATLEQRVDAFARARPDIVLIAPYMAYLALLSLVSIVPAEWEWAAIAVRGVGSLAIVWLLRKHLPLRGNTFPVIAVLGGFAAAWLWYQGQYWFDAIGLGGRLPIYPGQYVVADPRFDIGAYRLFRVTCTLRILVACTAVPIVEEVFWRGFLLRAMIDWNRFERVPVGKFTWFSFLGTSLISTLQHPDNWAVSIFCWMLFNGLFYLTRSVPCLILVHAITNLVLYAQVLRVDDWKFW